MRAEQVQGWFIACVGCLSKHYFGADAPGEGLFTLQDAVAKAWALGYLVEDDELICLTCQRNGSYRGGRT